MALLYVKSEKNADFVLNTEKIQDIAPTRDGMSLLFFGGFQENYYKVNHKVDELVNMIQNAEIVWNGNINNKI